MADDDKALGPRTPRSVGEAVVAKAKARLGGLVHDMIDAATQVPDDSWSASKKKVWQDLNQPHATAPVWIRALQGPITKLLAEAAPERSGMSVTLVNLTVSSREQWEEMRDKMRAQDEERRKVEAIEVEATDPRDPA